jgi:hypothetical protein
MKRISSLAPPTVLVALTLLAGCGGDDGGTAPDAGTGSGAEEALVDDGATTDDPFTGPTTAPVDGGLPDPCTLVTAEEATAVIGEPATSPGAVPQLGSPGLECT